MSAPSESQMAAGPDLAPVLVGLLRREGLGLLQQRGRLNGLLRDYAPGAIRDIRLLLTAYDGGVPQRLGEAPEPAAAPLLAAEADRLVEDFGCARPLALNAVATWGRAFASLRAPAAQASAALSPAAAGIVPPSASPTAPVQTAHEDEPGVIGRWGGIAVGLALVAFALLRWLGLM